jgi:hypothetical protein
MTTVKWMLGLTLIVVLAACGGNTKSSSVKLTLTPSKAEVASGENVTLTATVTEGVAEVATIDFAIKGSDAFAKDVKAGEDGKYSTPTTVDNTTTFTATAKNSAGTVVGTPAEATVSVSQTLPNAEDKSGLTTLAGIPVVGGEATGLAVVTDKLVATGGKAEKVEGSEDGGVATVLEDGSFTFTPDGSKDTATFKYKVVGAGGSDEATVSVTVKPLPANTVIASNLAALTAATATASNATTIIINGTITCGPVDCVTLKAGQRLVGAGVIDDVTLGGVAKIDATVSAAESTPPENNNITVITLAPDTTIEGLEISGRDIYTAINGVDNTLRQPGSPVDDPVASTITLKNITIIGPTSNAPLAIRHNDDDPFGSFYNLNAEGITITNATNPIGINAFSSLNFKNSTINMNIDYALGAKEFGLSFHAYGDATAAVDNVNITSAQGNPEFSPLKFAQSSGGGVYNITVSNNDVSFEDGVNTASANAYLVNFGNNAATDGKIVISTEASKGNTTNSTAGDKAKFIVAGTTNISARIEGQLELNGQLLPAQ